ncbi:MAG: hypothetical protein FJY55_08945, partial [Betaproteobacteria bacterium]|nr:hypothetical protein [Betaproteobacteria bacterium]
MATRAVPVEYVLVCEAFHELVRLYGRGEPPAINVPDFREPTPEQRAEKGGAFDWLQAVVIDAIERGELEPLVLQADRQLSVPGYYWRGAFADLALAGETLCEIALEQDDRYLASHRLVFRRAEWQAWRDAFAAAVERHAGLPMQRDAPPAGRALPAGSISLRDAFRELLETLVSYRDVSLLLALQAGRSNDLPKRGRARLKELQDEAEALTLDALASGALPNRILTEPPAEPVTLSPKYWRHANGGVLSLHHGVVIANALHADDRARLAGRPIVLPDADFADWLCERRKALTPEPKVPEDGFTRAAWSLGQAVAWV